MRTLRSLIFLLAFLATGCARQETPLADPPSSLGGGLWTRSQVERPSADNAPAAMKAFRPTQWLRASYRNASGTVELEIYRLPGETSAFEARQKWLGESGTASINAGSLFAVARSSPDRMTELGGFLRLLEAEWLRAQR